MGFCSYCYQHAGSSYGLSDECYSWDAARACSGITGPDDPVRKERMRRYDLARAKRMRDEAKELRKKAMALEAEAERYEHTSR